LPIERRFASWIDFLIFLIFLIVVATVFTPGRGITAIVLADSRSNLNLRGCFIYEACIFGIYGRGGFPPLHCESANFLADGAVTATFNTPSREMEG
jgi:hypothetical protein